MLPRLKKRSSDDYAGEEYDDDYYADNVGVIISNSQDEEYYELTPQEKALLDSYDVPYYGDSLGQVLQNPDPGLLEEVTLDSHQGQASFICSVNLAPGVLC